MYLYRYIYLVAFFLDSHFGLGAAACSGLAAHLGLAAVPPMDRNLDFLDPHTLQVAFITFRGPLTVEIVEVVSPTLGVFFLHFKQYISILITYYNN